MSFIDGIVGIYVILMLIFKFPPITMICAGYLIIKGIWSMF